MARKHEILKNTNLNDDRIIVRRIKEKFWIYGTPWHGDLDVISPKGVPVKRIFFLKHSKKNSVSPKRGAEAVSMLLTRSFPPLWDKNRDERYNWSLFPACGIGALL